MRSLGFFAPIIAALGTFGCGDSLPKPPELPPLVPVKGKVFFHDKPIAGVTVTFHPLFDMGNGVKFTPHAKTGEDGSFALTSGPDGAPKGEYAVTFAYMEQFDPGDAGGVVDRWKGRYDPKDPKLSKFKVKVGDGENNLEPFKLN